MLIQNYLLQRKNVYQLLQIGIEQGVQHARIEIIENNLSTHQSKYWYGIADG